MFTGIIETTGKLIRTEALGSNVIFWIESNLAPELKIDQSLSHNGVCLTVEEITGNLHRVTAIAETIQKTNVQDWITGSSINLERCLPMNGRLDGHIVQGHVDTTAQCTQIENKEGSYTYRFEMDEKFATLIIEKGSICINGISLTLFDVSKTGFTVAIIPYTFKHTNMQYLKLQDRANIEFDMLGKYVNRIIQLK